MENQNRLKLRISRMFRSSFGSCRTRNLTDVMEKAVFAPPNPIEVEQPSPKTINNTCILSFKDSLPRRKISEWSSPFVLGGGSKNKNNNLNLNLGVMPCPPTSSNISLNTVHEQDFGYDDKKKVSTKNSRTKKKKKKKKRRAQNKREFFPFNSCARDTNFGGYWWYSSDEDDETDTLFSSKSLSSDSSRSRRRCRRRENDRSSDMGVLPLHGKVKDTFAVVKRSSDPYSDFRTSMLEMIVEKQIFSPADLENLLQCFLSLNSHHHHKIIVHVFTEIWEALFSDWF
ncbi:transcription repressor OFP8-like [Glycine soja]|uniref:Transcription repressor n=1 Tax=Glycine soja TaxID=3848 RepID=A0A445KSK1_GLYSO|nr:transcription repressor OFP8-like [Glycine soja]RZC13907.1 Transcription repressor OFP8 [Glycine soja]